MIRTHYDTIYLSPHLDDAALSCGGQIFMETAVGNSVLIVTIMAGDPPAGVLSELAQVLHDRWELAADAVAARRAEDAEACRILGAEYLHWDAPDCIYRSHPETGRALYQTEQEIFGFVHPAEQVAMVAQLAQRLATLPSPERLLVPLTVGNHVDHQLVRLAAEKWSGRELLYYEDYPYVRISGALALALSKDAEQWQAHNVPLDAAALQARIEAIAAYASQVSSFFSSRAELEAEVKAYVQEVGGERIWQRRRLK